MTSIIYLSKIARLQWKVRGCDCNQFIGYGEVWKLPGRTDGQVQP